ncbi:WD40 repeat domain-containing protein [Aspergillus tanneri]|uniref:Uncharacterized protein n=1 Tax=Aspergillus tanneri TaxID=1220188 RepID=A0A5M9MTW7_9EURO|nr:uncharacterized protein ATNIH1004_004655 [Aspergillus tanneri]KAA8648770.1 hypothetical protein ATNIH1004_004655 [Aspergillus tanneri]
MVSSKYHRLQRSDSSSADSLPTPELVTSVSQDDESEASIDLAITPPPLSRSESTSKYGQSTYFPSIDKAKDFGSILVAPAASNKEPTNSDAQPSPTPLVRPVLPASNAKRRIRERRYTVSGAIGEDPKSPVLLDRFIPDREFINSPSTLFRVGKRPQELSPDEKFLRHRSPREDPFMPGRIRRFTRTLRVVSSRFNSTHYGPHLVSDSATTASGSHRSRVSPRQISDGAVWHVGGTSAALGRRPMAVIDDAGAPIASGTTAPTYTAKFLPQVTSTEDQKKHESRVALALDIDPAARLLKQCKRWPLLESTPDPSTRDYERSSPLVWKDNAWKKAERDNWTTEASREQHTRMVPTRPFRILDAPLLRDDFYCSTLAYSPTAGVLAVGLGHRVYLWSELFGVQYPPLRDQHSSNYVTSLAFSSENGGKSILAVARHSGTLCLWSTFDSEVRFEVSHPETITCVAFKQTKSRRLSERFGNVEIDTEDLAVGDDSGTIWYYSVEWADESTRNEYDWQGSMTLLAKITAHSQQVCGITWSPDGNYMATGGNDNACLIFELHEIIPAHELGIVEGCCPSTDAQGTNVFSSFSARTSRQILGRYRFVSHLFPSWNRYRTEPLSTSLLSFTGSLVSGGDRTTLVPPNRQKHKLIHSAAVKAIAFAPWQPSLLATGGGSNDRAIHFYHTPSGACLATISVYAQVTSLIWSRTRREIAATFGFAQPEHPFRIAVFAWPSCEQIAAVPWGPYGSSWDGPENHSFGDCGRALCAVSYPGRPPTYPGSGFECPEGFSASKMQGRLNRRGRSVHCPRSSQRATMRPRAKEGGLWCSRTMEEGCIIVASSDESVKFHEVWSNTRRNKAAVSSPYGGNGILEGLEGLEKPGNEIIR